MRYARQELYEEIGRETFGKKDLDGTAYLMGKLLGEF